MQRDMQFRQAARRTARRVAVALVVVIAVAGLIPHVSAQRQATQTITEEDDGAIVRMRVGETLAVDLPEGPDEAYTWLLVPTETFAQADVIIGDVWAVGPAALAGFEVGDHIVTLDGEPVKSTVDLTRALDARPGEVASLMVERDGEQITLDLTLEAFDDPGIERPILTGFLEGMPAAEAGFEVGDVLLAIDGEEITSITALQAAIAAKEGAEVVITVRRGEDKLELPVAPQVDVDGVVRIGISIVALDYTVAGLGLANLNVESYLGVRPFNALFPMPQGVPRRFVLVQRDDPVSQAGRSRWQFEAIAVGETRLTLLNLDPNQAVEDIAPEQFFEVLVVISPASGPAA